MASRKGTECPSRRPRSKSTPELHLHLCGSHFSLDKDLLVQKSAKIAKLLQKNPLGDLSVLLSDIPGDHESMDLVGRFCHGFEINLLPENVVPVVCVSHYLGMTDSHCPDNLLSKGLLYYEQHVIPSWSNCIKALKNSVNVLHQAINLGLVDSSVNCIISKVQEDPSLLGEPIKNDEVEENMISSYQTNPRRKLFDPCWKSEDLTSLPLVIYESIMAAIIQQQVPQEYVAANLCKYAKRWIFSQVKLQDDTPTAIYVMNSLRETVESLVSMLPNERGVVPCSFLFQFLRYAIALDASAECKNALEVRIGKQLDQASVNDLLIPSHGYANDERYDTECVRRIVKHYYCNYHSQDHPCGLISVAELIDEFLAVISADIDMKISTFVALADVSVLASAGTQRTLDGVYRAIDIYLDKHKHLTESEREELCRILDCNKMSAEACEHAAQNERLPVRVVVQVLFVTQLKLREAVTREVVGSEGRLMKLEEDGDGMRTGCNREEVRSEMDKMGNKVSELEKECSVMRREIESGGVKRQKTSMWKEMKRKFGCGTSMHDSHCHVKKKKKV